MQWVNVKRKSACLQSRYPNRFSGLYINYPQLLKFHLSVYLSSENAAQFSAAVAILSVPIFIPPGTHYWWVDRGGVDLKLAQGFNTWPALWELNPRPLDLRVQCLNHSATCSSIINKTVQILQYIVLHCLASPIPGVFLYNRLIYMLARKLDSRCGRRVGWNEMFDTVTDFHFPITSEGLLCQTYRQLRGKRI